MPQMPRPLRWLRVDRRVWTRAALLGLAFFLLAMLSEPFIFRPYETAVVWLPGGLALGVLARARRAHWPVYLLAIFVAEVSKVFMFGDALHVASIWGVSNVLRTVIAAYLMQRFVGAAILFERMRDVAALVLFGGIAGPLVSGSLSAGAAVVFLGAEPYWREALMWFLSDSLGTVLIAPLVLAFRPSMWKALPVGRTLEWIAFFAVLIVVADFLFGYEEAGIRAALPYASFPLLIWAALRMGPFGAAASAVVMGSVAILHTLDGRGPFALDSISPGPQLLAVELFLTLVSLSVLTLAAAVRERRRAEQVERLLADIGGLFTESLDLEVMLPRVVRRLVSDGPTSASIWLRQDGKYERIASEGLSPQMQRRLEQQIEHLPEALRSWVDPQKQVMLIPLRGTRRTVGVLAVSPGAAEHVLLPSERERMESLAHRCALAIENALLYEEAQRAIRTREEFIAIAAHELRTPLTTLKLQLEFAARRADEASAGRIGKLQDQVWRLTRLVENLLDISRLTRGTLQLSRERVSLPGLIRDVAERMAPDAERRGSRLSLHLQERLEGHWDRVRLEQILTNLINNAVKFGEGHPVELTLGAADGRAMLTVTDHGSGIPEEELEHIFDRFAQAVSAREYGGLGLGLFVARQIAEAHGGRLWATSRRGEGSTFHLELPALPSAEAWAAEPRP